MATGDDNGGKKRKRPLLEAVSDDGDSKFARALASVDFHTRERGLQALTLWLSRKADVGEFELLKLWKGVFYCFWHSDKAPVQTALAERLSEMVLQLPEQVALLYYTVFIKTMRREWFGMDHLRLDKFLMLIRKFFHQALLLLQTGGWSAEQLAQYTDLWLHQVLLPSDGLVAAGMAYHLCDLLMPELAKAAAAGPPGGWPQQATLHALLEPFCQALASTRDPALIYRLRQGLFEPLVQELSSQPDSLWQRLDAEKLAAHLFDLGAKQETRAKNREALYGFSSALEKVAKRQLRKQGEGKGAERAAQQQQVEGAGGEQQQANGAGGEQQQPKSARKKKRRVAEEAGSGTPGAVQQQAQQQQQQQQEPQPAEGPLANGVAAPPTSSKKKKREQAGAEGRQHTAAGTPVQQQQQAEPLEQQQQHTTGKKKRQQQQGEQQQQDQAPPPTSAKKKKKQAAAASGSGEGTPLPAGTPVQGAAGSAAPPTTGKKNVRFALRRNLVMTIGQPPLPEDVRTPPTAKPKGPALKATSSLTKGTAAATPRSAPGRLNNAGKQQTRSRLAQGGGSKSAAKASGGSRPLVSPHALPRVRAADLF